MNDEKITDEENESAFMDVETYGGVYEQAETEYAQGNGEKKDTEEKNDFVEKSDEKKWVELHDWMKIVFTTIICAIFVFIFIGRQIGVKGDSMLPTLHWYDKIVVSNMFYTPKNGDIVVFQTPSDIFGGTPLVKRVIATQGQEIDINFETGEVFVDKKVLDEPYINESTHSRQDFDGPVVVPEGHIFVMGDNRNRSSDSRSASVGFVDTRHILGKVLFLIIPGGDQNNQRNWHRIGSVYS